jgi:phosphatidylglycerol---prolipoprotein diacylglyceryl transferase
MRRILFQWRGITIWSYPAMLYLGLLIEIIAGNAAAHVLGLESFRAYQATLTLLVTGLIGARLFHVARRWRWYRARPSRIWNRADGGMSMYGGFLVMLPVSVPLLATLQLPFAAFWDTMVYTTLVLLIFARVGCLLHGCCAGHPSRSWIGIRLPNAAGVWERRLPTPLLEAAWCGGLLLVAVAMGQSVPFPGALALVSAAGYGAGRLVLQSTRERESDTARYTHHHVISLALVVFSLVELHIRWPK